MTGDEKAHGEATGLAAIREAEKEVHEAKGSLAHLKARLASEAGVESEGYVDVMEAVVDLTGQLLELLESKGASS